MPQRLTNERDEEERTHMKHQTSQCCQMPLNNRNVLIKSRGKMRTPLLVFSFLNKSACHSVDLHAFWRLPLVLQAQTFYFFRSLLFFHSFFPFFPFFSLIEENCFVRQILFTVRLQITISTDFGENSWYFLSLSLSLFESCSCDERNSLHIEFVYTSTVIRNCCSFWQHLTKRMSK